MASLRQFKTVFQLEQTGDFFLTFIAMRDIENLSGLGIRRANQKLAVAIVCFAIVAGFGVDDGKTHIRGLKPELSGEHGDAVRKLFVSQLLFRRDLEVLNGIHTMKGGCVRDTVIDILTSAFPEQDMLVLVCLLHKMMENGS
ncbi:hypothetical protein Gbth_010_032 [Gluconobacter thailandicus F149-1 = NBRC 100600]|nr:hypothetical protein Gbth_010_032 [Gluconobacter thailandicus F149-1 = NBRC 100600]GEL88320.1 hypothetical protein GTH01_26780 [Gluconobacter thailandicus F149-1 = NBRC 100600]